MLERMVPYPFCVSVVVISHSSRRSRRNSGNFAALCVPVSMCVYICVYVYVLVRISSLVYVSERRPLRCSCRTLLDPISLCSRALSQNSGLGCADVWTLRLADTPGTPPLCARRTPYVHRISMVALQHFGIGSGAQGNSFR